ncbi:MAG: hypothetical protein HYR85_24730 [Planctomycetes bacterium]|nr:hypothetical protein [Planctomycetota bacterium]MBI3846712.1 hypothetical protein [Planctomycetota bacterium]
MRAKRVVSLLWFSWLLAASGRAQPLQPRIVVHDLRGNYAVDGTALFGTGSGQISIITVPTSPGSAVKSAYLYWDVLGDPSGPPAGANLGVFMGNAIVGTLIGSGGQLDQPQAANYSYFADVTSSIPLPGGNGQFTLSGFSPAAEGASLVLIWMNTAFANRDIVIVDGNATVNAASPSVMQTLTGFQATSPVTGAAVAFIVADGQAALADFTVFGTTGVFVNTLDGSTPPAGVELWDNDNYPTQASNVPPGATSVQTTIVRPTNGDSVAWVATPFSVTSPMPIVEVLCTPLARVGPRNSNFAMGVRVESHTNSNVQITGQIDVYRATGQFVATMAGPRSGVVPPGTVFTATLSRRIPTHVSPQIVGVPLFVVAKIFRRGTTMLIDDDFVECVIQ